MSPKISSVERIMKLAAKRNAYCQGVHSSSIYKSKTLEQSKFPSYEQSSKSSYKMHIMKKLCMHLKKIFLQKIKLIFESHFSMHSFKCLLRTLLKSMPVRPCDRPSSWPLEVSR